MEGSRRTEWWLDPITWICPCVRQMTRTWTSQKIRRSRPSSRPKGNCGLWPKMPRGRNDTQQTATFPGSRPVLSARTLRLAIQCFSTSRLVDRVPRNGGACLSFRISMRPEWSRYRGANPPELPVIASANLRRHCLILRLAPGIWRKCCAMENGPAGW